VLPLKAENLPAAHVTQAVPDAMDPGAHALQAVTEPPSENVSGGGQAVHTSSGLLYWPGAHGVASM
jgi:hypothetical protein